MLVWNEEWLTDHVSVSCRGGYDVPNVAKSLDFINLMAYDFHGKWESQAGHNAPLYAPSSDSQWRKQLSVSFAAQMWTRYMKLKPRPRRSFWGMDSDWPIGFACLTAIHQPRFYAWHNFFKIKPLKLTFVWIQIKSLTLRSLIKVT